LVAPVRGAQGRGDGALRAALPRGALAAIPRQLVARRAHGAARAQELVATDAAPWARSGALPRPQAVGRVRPQVMAGCHKNFVARGARRGGGSPVTPSRYGFHWSYFHCLRQAGMEHRLLM